MPIKETGTSSTRTQSTRKERKKQRRRAAKNSRKIHLSEEKNKTADQKKILNEQLQTDQQNFDLENNAISTRISTVNLTSFSEDSSKIEGDVKISTDISSNHKLSQPLIEQEAYTKTSNFQRLMEPSENEKNGSIDGFSGSIMNQNENTEYLAQNYNSKRFLDSKLNGNEFNESSILDTATKTATEPYMYSIYPIRTSDSSLSQDRKNIQFEGASVKDSFEKNHNSNNNEFIVEDSNQDSTCTEKETITSECYSEISDLSLVSQERDSKITLDFDKDIFEMLDAQKCREIPIKPKNSVFNPDVQIKHGMDHLIRFGNTKTSQKEKELTRHSNVIFSVESKVQTDIEKEKDFRTRVESRQESFLDNGVDKEIDNSDSYDLGKESIGIEKISTSFDKDTKISEKDTKSCHLISDYYIGCRTDNPLKKMENLHNISSEKKSLEFEEMKPIKSQKLHELNLKMSPNDAESSRLSDELFERASENNHPFNGLQLNPLQNDIKPQNIYQIDKIDQQIIPHEFINERHFSEEISVTHPKNFSNTIKLEDKSLIRKCDQFGFSSSDPDQYNLYTDISTEEIVGLSAEKRHSMASKKSRNRKPFLRSANETLIDHENDKYSRDHCNKNYMHHSDNSPLFHQTMCSDSLNMQKGKIIHEFGQVSYDASSFLNPESTENLLKKQNQLLESDLKGDNPSFVQIASSNPQNTKSDERRYDIMKFSDSEIEISGVKKHSVYQNPPYRRSNIISDPFHKSSTHLNDLVNERPTLHIESIRKINEIHTGQKNNTPDININVFDISRSKKIFLNIVPENVSKNMSKKTAPKKTVHNISPQEERRNILRGYQRGISIQDFKSTVNIKYVSPPKKKKQNVLVKLFSKLFR